MSRDLVVEEIEIHQRAALRPSLKPSKSPQNLRASPRSWTENTSSMSKYQSLP
jgi:hypothetical protein